MSEMYSSTSPIVIDLQYHEIQGTWTQTVDARKLHERLEIVTRFNDWIARRIDEYCFVEGRDYLFYSNLSKTPGRPEHAFYLTLDMAKEMCMVERTPAGRAARQYFLYLRASASGDERNRNSIADTVRRTPDSLGEMLHASPLRLSMTSLHPPACCHRLCHGSKSMRK